MYARGSWWNFDDGVLASLAIDLLKLAHTHMCLLCGPSFMGPILFSSLWALIIWGFIQLFFHPGPIGQMIYALLGAFIFSGYIVYDTYLLLARALRNLLVHGSDSTCL